MAVTGRRRLLHLPAAAQCAASVQRGLTAHRRSAGFAPQVRIGIHADEAIVATTSPFLGAVDEQ